MYERDDSLGLSKGAWTGPFHQPASLVNVSVYKRRLGWWHIYHYRHYEWVSRHANWEIYRRYKPLFSLYRLLRMPYKSPLHKSPLVQKLTPDQKPLDVLCWLSKPLCFFVRFQKPIVYYINKHKKKKSTLFIFKTISHFINNKYVPGYNAYIINIHKKGGFWEP